MKYLQPHTNYYDTTDLSAPFTDFDGTALSGVGNSDPASEFAGVNTRHYSTQRIDACSAPPRDAVERMFNAFVKKGQHSMGSQQFKNWIKSCKVLNMAGTLTDKNLRHMDLVFSKATGGRMKMDFKQFKKALLELRQKHTEFQTTKELVIHTWTQWTSIEGDGSSSLSGNEAGRKEAELQIKREALRIKDMREEQMWREEEERERRNAAGGAGMKAGRERVGTQGRERVGTQGRARGGVGVKGRRGRAGAIRGGRGAGTQQEGGAKETKERALYAIWVQQEDQKRQEAYLAAVTFVENVLQIGVAVSL
jgi:hypothetical protein